MSRDDFPNRTTLQAELDPWWVVAADLVAGPSGHLDPPNGCGSWRFFSSTGPTTAAGAVGRLGLLQHAGARRRFRCCTDTRLQRPQALVAQLEPRTLVVDG